SVAAYDTTDNYVGSAVVDTNGNYLLTGLPAGTYHAVAYGSGFEQLYNGTDCPSNCGPQTGTPIVVADGQDTAGIDFDPMPSDYIFGRVTDGNGAGIAAVALDLWQASDGTHCGVGVTNADGYYALDSTTVWCERTFRISTDVDPALYENQVYDGVPC